MFALLVVENVGLMSEKNVKLKQFAVISALLFSGDERMSILQRMGQIERKSVIWR